jgi:hypothetical protein
MPNRELRRANHKSFKSGIKSMSVRELRSMVFNINDEGNLGIAESWIMAMDRQGLITFVTEFHRMTRK